MEVRGPHRGKSPNAGWERQTKDTVLAITGTSFSQCSNFMPAATAKYSGNKNSLGKQRVYFSYNSSSYSSQQDSHNGVRNLKSLVTSHSPSSAQ